ncbi:MAG TPA: hypothetical protein VFD32_12420 [Dehalococcoidia bacterium]|nr:hypothetical protein [Dehalococcoidia bacterium]
MLTWCKRRARRVRVMERVVRTPAADAEGRWQVVVHAWATALEEALKLTQGNVEAAVAIAATMIFMD